VNNKPVRLLDVSMIRQKTFLNDFSFKRFFKQNDVKSRTTKLLNNLWRVFQRKWSVSRKRNFVACKLGNMSKLRTI